MEYKLEELLPLVVKLTDKFTSKESSSIPYETAEMLMEAVIYYVDAGCTGTSNRVVSGTELPTAELMYEKGSQIIFERVCQAKEIYQSIIQEFEDYSCQNYAATILQGMPAFFIHYNMKFNPQNHILTLDYPLLNGTPALTGINLILEYLKAIQWEQKFLQLFDKQMIESLLDRVMPQYQELYLDNLCSPVLLNAVGCAITGGALLHLSLKNEDYENLYLYFKHDDIPQIAVKINKTIHILLRQTLGHTEYFEKAADSYAARIYYGIQSHSLEQIFI